MPTMQRLASALSRTSCAPSKRACLSMMMSSLVVGEPTYVDDVYRVVLGVAGRGELALELLDVVRERGFEAVRGVLLERVDSTWYLCPSRASAESSGYSGTCPLSILNR